MSDGTLSSRTPIAPQRVLSSVVEQQEVAPGYYRLTLSAPIIAGAARAGQFVHVLPRPSGEGGWQATPTFDPLLRRAFSIMRVAGEQIEILYRAGGKGTQLMTRWDKGDRADLLGPLGLGFGDFATHNVLVGGGVGVPPMVMLAARGRTESRACTALIGARSAQDVLCEADFDALGTPFEVATENGSRGKQGRVTASLLRHLASDNASQTKIFACGPLPMLRAVAQLCAQYGVACEVSMEEAMPCGVGVCNGCVVPMLQGSDDYGLYRRICIEGPVLSAAEVDWERI